MTWILKKSALIFIIVPIVSAQPIQVSAPDLCPNDNATSSCSLSAQKKRLVEVFGLKG
jgi:hypothetical protein